MAAVTPLTPQDVADAVNTLGIDKPTFEAFLTGAALLQKREAILAQVAATQAQGQAAAAATQTAVQALQTEYQAVQQQIQALPTGS